jgi:hypothetical protein
MSAQLAAIARLGELLRIGAPTPLWSPDDVDHRRRTATSLERNTMGMPYRARINERTLLNLTGGTGGHVTCRLFAGVAQRRRTGLRSRGAHAHWGFESLHPHSPTNRVNRRPP